MYSTIIHIRDCQVSKWGGGGEVEVLKSSERRKLVVTVGRCGFRYRITITDILGTDLHSIYVNICCARNFAKETRVWITRSFTRVYSVSNLIVQQIHIHAHARAHTRHLIGWSSNIINSRQKIEIQLLNTFQKIILNEME